MNKWARGTDYNLEESQTHKTDYFTGKISPHYKFCQESQSKQSSGKRNQRFMHIWILGLS